jgi:RimJ/RimL family protein N-acetyltransferase
LGLPALAVSTADNQKKQLEDAARAGLVYVPEVSLGDQTFLARHIGALLENRNLREHVSRHAMAAVEGLGVSIAISAMGVNDIEMRIACKADSENLFQWRNHPSIRAFSRNPAEIAWQDHQRWLDTVLNEGHKILLIGHISGVPAGVVRFDMDGEEAEISIYVVPEMLSRGLGADLLRSAENWLATNVSGPHRIRAHVLGENTRSQRLFSDAGYRIESFYYLKELH